MRATIRTWQHHQRLQAAWEADEGWTSYGHVNFTAEDDEVPPQLETSEMLTRLWIDGERVRAENEGDNYSHLGIKVGRL